MRFDFKTMAKPFDATVMRRPFWNSVSSLMYCSSSASSSSAMNVLKTGDVLKQARIFSTSDIAGYSKLTHDSNPLHFDSERARNAGFADIPVPGMLVATLFPRIIASHFPGAIYVKQTLDFRSPVFVGDNIIGQVQASNIRQMKQKYMVKFVTTCFKDGEIIVIGGEAMAMLPTLAMKQVDNHSSESKDFGSRTKLH
ncbi:(R)-specific enoyl-CoA hydratase [Sesamum angolense]|uniref:(R)-specific enoyl-CoA hydratase n=1 Tax=Sesamum angolense TaxID=2727404 RepID=A0AAE1XAX5_9LAMI|nr:(R)-specific enoyl-CoA hydratase [Sesamum angolense]